MKRFRPQLRRAGCRVICPMASGWLKPRRALPGRGRRSRYPAGVLVPPGQVGGSDGRPAPGWRGMLRAPFGQRGGRSVNGARRKRACAQAAAGDRMA
ncbi:MAG: hypothetical protein Q8Q63_12315, partial [Phaeovulum sp.]|nr:hypothetical protein [Phaeovulum sp.]